MVLPPSPTRTSSSLSSCPGPHLGKPGACGSFHFYSSNPNSSGLLESCSLHPSSCPAGGVIFLNYLPPQTNALAPPGQQQNIYKPPMPVLITSISLTSCLLLHAFLLRLGCNIDYIPALPNHSNAQDSHAFFSVGHQPSSLFQLRTQFISKRLSSNATISMQLLDPSIE